MKGKSACGIGDKCKTSNPDHMLLKATRKKSKPLKEVFAEGRDIKGEGGNSFLRFQDGIKSQQTDPGDFTYMLSSCPVNQRDVSKLFCLRYS